MGCDAQLDIMRYAAELGFSAAYCVAPLASDGAPPEVKTLVLLVRAYAPGGGLVDRFYPASNAAYHAARKLGERLEQALSCRAMPLPQVRLKPLCRRLAAFGSGRNTLNYLPRIGSRFCMELLGLTAELTPSPMRPYDPHFLPCSSCRRCMEACPTGAIREDGFHRERCIRHHMLSGKAMPEEMRPLIGSDRGVRGIVGCDICQRACPANAEMEKQRVSTDDFTLEELLACTPETVERFAALYGKNYAVRNRLLAQAALAAAHTGDPRYLPDLERLCESASPTVAEHARWAVEILKKTAKIY